MSRVANNLPTINYNNGFGQSNKSSINRTPSNASTTKSTNKTFQVRSAAPPPIQKETVHACPLCNDEYKDPRVLPCTHTYCFNCIRDKLIKNSRITCPKCHYQAHPFDEIQLNDLPPNLILSQEWRIGARPIVSVPTIKKPVTYQSNVSVPISQSIPLLTDMSQQQNKRKEITNGHTSTNGNNLDGIASIVNTFNQTVGNDNQNRSSSVSSTQPGVSSLIKIYSEANASKPQRNDSLAPSGKHDELVKIFEEASKGKQQQQRRTSSSPSFNKQQAKAHEEPYEEITWDNLVHGTTPVAPPFPEQLQTAIENRHYPPEATEQPMSISSSRQNSNIGNLCHVVSSIHHESPEKTPSIRQISIHDVHSNTHPLTSSSSSSSDDDDEDDDNLHVHETIQPLNPQRQYIRQISNPDSVRSGRSDSASRRSPISPIKIINQPKPNISSPYQQQQQQQQDDKNFHRTSSITSSSRPSSDRFPPPPQNLEIFHSPPNGIAQQRSTSSMSYRSSLNDDINTPEAKLTRTERFSPDVNNSPTNHRNNSSQIRSHFSTSTIEHNRQQENSFSPTSLSSTIIPNTVTSRVDTLLSDQKRLERDIDEQIRRLKYDYDDVRKQIDRKESAIHNEVKHIAARLDDDITEHYHRKQKIYADLAADTNTVGTELERLKTNTQINNNKQQLWANLEQIESSIRNIRQAVEQYKEPHNALTFSEGHQSLAVDTIGQITYNGIDSHQQRYSSSPVMNSQNEKPITNLTPYKYIKTDHLSTLEPEAIAITENNKKILLGICNKLFILNEYGDTLRTIDLKPSIRGIGLAKKPAKYNIAYVSHDEIISMIDIDSGKILDCVKETDSTGESGTFLPLGIDTDPIYGNVYVCDYRNSCVIKFDEKLEFLTQWRIYNHSERYDEARPKLISVYGQKLYMIVEHSCKPYYNQGIAYTFSLHICDINSGSIIKIIDADLLSTQRLRWPCSVQAINHDTCYILDTMTSGKYFNGQWQKHWSRVLQIGQDDKNLVKELFQLDSEAATMAMNKQTMIIAANGEILFVDLSYIQQQPK